MSATMEQPGNKKRKKVEDASQAAESSQAADDFFFSAEIIKLAKPVKQIRDITNYKDIRIVKTRIIGKHGIQEDGVCFYVSDGSIKFRHEGSDSYTPPVFLLQDRTMSEFHNKVLVEFSASGSGKTVDLAGAAASLGMDLTIVVSIEDTPELKALSDPDQRNIKAMELLTTKVSKVKKNTPDLATICGFASSKTPLKVAFSLDESSVSKNLVRSIISSHVDAATAVANGLGVPPHALVVRFMVGGTGAASGTIGSNTQNFKHVQPTGRVHHDLLTEMFLGEDLEMQFPGHPRAELVTTERIQDELPVLAALMQNGRMSSIAAAVLKDKAQLKEEIKEAYFVDIVIRKYIESNGMQNLVEVKNCEKSAVASCAFAVQLFQTTAEDKALAPPPGEEFEKFLNDMECGVVFCSEVAWLVGGEENPIQIIVSKYGLLEPNPIAPQPSRGIDKVFVMQPAQQLVALSLLGIQPEMLLEASPFGFEVLSTHVAKCAIAAASVIDKNTRPSLQQTLTKIGFQLDAMNNTSGTVEAYWKRLKHFKVASHEFNGGDGDDKAHFTRTMKVEMGLYESTDGKDLLLIDKIARESLIGMVAKDRKVSFSPPAAWINYGNSPLADGFVTFFCTTDEATVGNEAFRFTLMIQAKDYHNGSKLKTKKLKDHADRCSDAALNGVFGSERLLGVAGRKEVVHSKGATTIERNFMPYALDQGIVLAELLPTLESQRKFDTRISKLAVYCTSDGKTTSG